MQRVDLRRLLAAVEEAPPVDVVDVLAVELARMVDASHVSLLIANFSGDCGRPAVARHPEGAPPRGHYERVESLSLNESVSNSVLSSQAIEVVRQATSWLVLVPVTERGDPIGVLELSLRGEPDGESLGHLLAAAHARAYVLIASRWHTDLFEWAQRDIPFSLAAELQRRLLPSAYTAEGGAFIIAGWLEPAHDAGGDTFDYTVDREYVYVSITDAMGHSTEAAILATIAVGSLRDSRRALASPAEQADLASANLCTHAQGDQFVTGLLIRIRLADGTAELVNSGHPRPYLARDGRSIMLDSPPSSRWASRPSPTRPSRSSCRRRPAPAPYRWLPRAQGRPGRHRRHPGCDAQPASPSDRSRACPQCRTGDGGQTH